MPRKSILNGVTRDTFRFILAYKQNYAVFFAVAIFAFTITDFISLEGDQTVGFSVALEFYDAALLAISTAIVAVPLHRFIIEDQFSLLPKHIANATLFAGLEFLLSIVSLAALFWVFGGLNFLSGIFSGGLFWISFLLWSAVGLALFLCSIGLGVILTTVLPHIAVTQATKLDLKYSLRLSRGFRVSIFLRLFRLSVLAGIALSLVAFLTNSNNLASRSDETAIEYYVSLLMQNSLYAVVVILFITLASFIYLRLSEHRDEILRHE